MVLLCRSPRTQTVHSRPVFHMVVCSGPAVSTSHAGGRGPANNSQSADIITALGSGSEPPERGLPESFTVRATVMFLTKRNLVTRFHPEPGASIWAQITNSNSNLVFSNFRFHLVLLTVA